MGVFFSLCFFSSPCGNGREPNETLKRVQSVWIQTGCVWGADGLERKRRKQEEGVGWDGMGVGGSDGVRSFTSACHTAAGERWTGRSSPPP